MCDIPNSSYSAKGILENYSGASAREARQRSTKVRKIGNPSSRENLVMTSA